MRQFMKATESSLMSTNKGTSAKVSSPRLVRCVPWNFSRYLLKSEACVGSQKESLIKCAFKVAQNCAARLNLLSSYVFSTGDALEKWWTNIPACPLTYPHIIINATWIVRTQLLKTIHTQMKYAAGSNFHCSHFSAPTGAMSSLHPSLGNLCQSDHT